MEEEGGGENDNGEKIYANDSKGAENEKSQENELHDGLLDTSDRVQDDSASGEIQENSKEQENLVADMYLNADVPDSNQEPINPEVKQQLHRLKQREETIIQKLGLLGLGHEYWVNYDHEELLSPMERVVLFESRLSDLKGLFATIYFADELDNEVPELQQQTQECSALKSMLGLAPREPQEENEKYECPICCEEVPMKDCVRLSCGHKYCRACLTSYFESRVDAGLLLVIPCPNTKLCSEPIVERDIKAVLDESRYERYVQFHDLQKFRKEPATRWCPEPDCGTAVLGDPLQADFPKLTCPKCQTEFCNDCNLIWHPGISCKKALKNSRKGEKGGTKSDKWKKTHKTRPCPQCRIPIHKDSGCNHMHCSSCGYQFCWICMQTFTPDHYFQGECAGLQFSSFPKMRKVGRKCARYCKLFLCCCCVVFCCPFVILLIFFFILFLLLVLLITFPLWCCGIVVYCTVKICTNKKDRRRENMLRD